MHSDVRDLLIHNLGVVHLDLLLGHGMVVEVTLVLLRWSVASTEEVATVAGIGCQEELGTAGEVLASLGLLLLLQRVFIIFRAIYGSFIVRRIIRGFVNICCVIQRLIIFFVVNLLLILSGIIIFSFHYVRTIAKYILSCLSGRK